MPAPVFARLSRAALDLLYPPRCAVCRSEGAFLCHACVSALPVAGGRRCHACWLPMRGGFCPSCAEHPGALAGLRAVWRYEGAVRRIVHAFKYGGQSALAPSLAAPMATLLVDHGAEADLLVPVPLTAARLRQRGYNQALLMAKEISRLSGTPVSNALRRTGHGAAQAATASAEERRRNVQGAFDLAPTADVAGLRVLLIDDVATTGATLNACASVLRRAGVLDVSACTLARED